MKKSFKDLAIGSHFMNSLKIKKQPKDRMVWRKLTNTKEYGNALCVSQNSDVLAFVDDLDYQFIECDKDGNIL